MSLRKIGFFILCFVVVVLSCKKDDGDDDGTPTVEIRDRGEQQEIDNELILEYFSKHYFNKSFFENNADARLSDLVIDSLIPPATNAPVDHVLLIDELNATNSILEKKNVVFRETDYEYYILKLKQGGGEGSPSFVDDIRVFYEGFLLNDEVFDSTLDIPVAFDLATDIGLPGGVSGWLNVFPNFNVAEDFVTNQDGTVDFIKPGVGVMFLPSGLAYFNIARPSISSYSPLIFKFELLQYFENDHDNDGIPSYLEVGVNTENLTIDTLEKLIEIDTDEDGNPDFLDSDDDGDGILTIDEDIDKDGDPSNDIGANNIPKYLDDTEIERKDD